MVVRSYVRRHITIISIFIFIITYSLLMIAKPSIIYNKDGSLRQFGIGFKKKTILPAWLISILLAIFSYFGVLYYISYPGLSL
jgi:hypothetical protein